MTETTPGAIYAELKADHDRHRAMLEKLSGADGGAGRAELFEQFRIEVSAHAAAEEQTLYATMLADPELQAEARHSVAEHKEIEDFLAEIHELDPADGEWAEKFAAMRHRYLHHIEEEEEEMFPEASGQLPGAVEEELAGRFEERKAAELEKAAATDPSEEAGRE